MVSKGEIDSTSELYRRHVIPRINIMSTMYEMVEKVGEGSNAKVYKGRSRILNNQIVAIKRLKLEEAQGIPYHAYKEISLLHMLSGSPHIVKLWDVERIKTRSGKSELHLVLEYLDSDLFQYIISFSENGDGIPLHIIKSFMYQLLKGVAHCHSHGIMHRDLKPQNILVDKGKVLLKIADLGHGRAFTVPMDPYSREILTLWYRAPEVLLGCKHYSSPVDIWSVGCIFAEMYLKKPLFTGNGEIQQLHQIFKLLGTPSEEMWPGLATHKYWHGHKYPQWSPRDLSEIVPNMDSHGLDLLSRMLQYDPSKRISAKEALNHPYFNSETQNIAALE